MSALGKQILAGLADARNFARGKTAGQRIHRVAVPEQIDVRRIRTRLQMTQSEFAATFGFSLSSVRNWEQGKRVPEGPARVLLTVIAREPTAVVRALRSKAAAGAR
jgi:putative transcriptional regulator